MLCLTSWETISSSAIKRSASLWGTLNQGLSTRSRCPLRVLRVDAPWLILPSLLQVGNHLDLTNLICNVYTIRCAQLPSFAQGMSINPYCDLKVNIFWAGFVMWQQG